MPSCQQPIGVSQQRVIRIVSAINEIANQSEHHRTINNVVCARDHIILSM